MPAIADMAAWEKVIKGRAGTRWDSVVEKVWKDIGGNQEQILTTEKFAGCKTEVKGRIDVRRRLLLLIALRNKVKEGHSTPLKPHSGLGTNYVKLESICPQTGLRF